jgi:hypothetical protein
MGSILKKDYFDYQFDGLGLLWFANPAMPMIIRMNPTTIIRIAPQNSGDSPNESMSPPANASASPSRIALCGTSITSDDAYYIADAMFPTFETRRYLSKTRQKEFVCYPFGNLRGVHYLFFRMEVSQPFLHY